jgi:hypothetical protein
MGTKHMKRRIKGVKKMRERKIYVWLLIGLLFGMVIPMPFGSASNGGVYGVHWQRDTTEGFVSPRVGTDDVNLSGNELLDANLSVYAGTNLSWSAGQFHSTGTGGGFWNRAGTTLYPFTNNDDVQVNGTITTDAIYLADDIFHAGDTNTYIGFQNDQIQWWAGGLGVVLFDNTQFLVNVNGASLGRDVDFTVDGKYVADLFRVDAGNNRVGILTGTPDQPFDVNGNTNITGDLNVTGIINNDAIYAQLSDSTDQTFGVIDTGYAITFNTNDEINGITHSTVSETMNITIVTSGVYSIIAQPQVHAGAGDAGYFHMWLRRDTGGGFVDIPNSNVELTLGSLDEDVVPLIVTMSLDAGDVLRVNASVGDTGIELDAQTPAGEPTIPSIIFSMYRIGA